MSWITSSLVTPKNAKGDEKEVKKDVIFNPKKYMSLEAKKFWNLQYHWRLKPKDLHKKE